MLILVGLLVSIGAHVLDGQDVLCGFVFAILCIGAFFLRQVRGKYMVVITYIDDGINDIMKMGLTEEFY